MLVLLTMGPGLAFAQSVDLHWTSPVKERFVTFYAEPQGKPPEEMTYLIEPANPDPKFQAEWEKEAQTNHNLIPKNRDVGIEIFNDFKKAVWVPFKTNLSVDFGPGDGERWLRIGFRMKGDEKPHRIGNSIYQNDMGGKWDAHFIVIQNSPLFVRITNPKETTTSQPMIQLRGYSPVPIVNLRYDVLDQNGNYTVHGGEGGITGQYYDPVRSHFTTNYFECLDISLSPGTNTIRFHCEDDAGNAVDTNFVYVFTTTGDTNPPVFKLDSPQDGELITGSKFDLRGLCDDPTANVTALICDEIGNSVRSEGFVERNGYLWVEHIPLAAGISHITIVASDAANNSSLTNITVGKSEDVLYMNPVANPQELWQPRISKVTGYYSRTNNSVTINGVKAKMKPDGHWVAENVPVKSSPGGGTAFFNMTSDYDEKLTSFDVWQPSILSEPTNSLRAGISFVSVSTNEYNHYPICLGVTNISGTNQPRNWMLSTFDRRFALRLLDKDGKAMAKREYFQKSGEGLPDNLDIHHLGKNELTNIDGIIPLSTNMAVQFASINLDEHFQMPPPGDYRLEVEERLFQIGDDGHLIPTTLPPVVSDLKVIDQPSEMTFYLKHLEQQKKLYWGTVLSSLRIGVANIADNHTSGRTAQIEIFLENLGANDIRNLRLPRLEEQFDISLFDTNGMLVAKTALGKQRGLPLTITHSSSDGIFGSVRRPRGFRPVFLSGKDVTEIGSVNLNELFEINSPGKYRLTYQQRFMQSDSTNKPTGLTMPMVVVPLDIID